MSLLLTFLTVTTFPAFGLLFCLCRVSKLADERFASFGSKVGRVQLKGMLQ